MVKEAGFAHFEALDWESDLNACEWPRGPTVGVGLIAVTRVVAWQGGGRGRRAWQHTLAPAGGTRLTPAAFHARPAPQTTSSGRDQPEPPAAPAVCLCVLFSCESLVHPLIRPRVHPSPSSVDARCIVHVLGRLPVTSRCHRGKSKRSTPHARPHCVPPGVAAADRHIGKLQRGNVA